VLMFLFCKNEETLKQIKMLEIILVILKNFFFNKGYYETLFSSNIYIDIFPSVLIIRN